MKIPLQELENLAISPDIPILGEVASLKQIGDKVFVTQYFYDDDTADEIERLIEARFPPTRVEVKQTTQAKKVQAGVTVKRNVNNVIAVASGKGGVGKSATAMNLALALSGQGAKVGVLDADIYGPSLPTMLNTHALPELLEGNTFKPNFSHGIESNSIGYLVEENVAMIWRAPKIVGALMQLMDDTAWGYHFDGKLDYLVIDLPPGTGDIALTMAQKIPVTGAVTVTTPQDIALSDAKRALQLFDKMQVSNLGVVENMSTHVCEQCGHESHIFGRHGGRDMAHEYDIAFLGDIPLDIAVRESLDNGEPIVIADPNHPISQRYGDIARQIAIALAKKPKNFSQVFGQIAVESAPKNTFH
ncbi:MAG: iron-sulfur cluster carrier protein ApbC [Gammaproteobacteria bacterium]|nr:MAG: iron-sulfur cluster carrier protein ApbC [Gammaproteobacteria bacterium]